jgi:hypothetical protein
MSANDPNARPPAGQLDAEPPPPPSPPSGTSWGTILQYVFFSGLGIAALVIIYTAVSGTGGFLGSLKEYNSARGLITFLIAFTTVALAVILVLASIISSSNDLKQRFELGREIFTALVGILGTIVGFYFASAPGAITPATPTPSPAALTAALPPAQTMTARVSTLSPQPGETVVITSFVNVGAPPYTYSITFDPEIIPAVRGAVSPEGFIRREVPIPAGYANGTPLRFRIDVSDSAGRALSFDHGAAGGPRVASP